MNLVFGYETTVDNKLALKGDKTAIASACYLPITGSSVSELLRLVQVLT